MIPTIHYHSSDIQIIVEPVDTVVRWGSNSFGWHVILVVPNAEPSWHGQVVTAINDSKQAIDAQFAAEDKARERAAEAEAIVEAMQ